MKAAPCCIWNYAENKEVLRLYHLREMAQIDYNSGMKKAKDEGRTEGRAEEKVEVARIFPSNLPCLLLL